MAAATEFLGTGRRKTSVARVRLAAGSGKFVVNGRPMENYFVVDSQRLLVMQPLVATESGAKFDIEKFIDKGHAFLRPGNSSKPVRLGLRFGWQGLAQNYLGREDRAARP